jgi:integrase/recombinase XerD
MNEKQKQQIQLLIAKFDEWLTAVKFHPNSRKRYCSDIRVFVDWLEENTSITTISEISPTHLQQYQIVIYNYEREKEGRLAASTQRHKLGTLRKFFGWLVDTQQLAYNPSASLKMPRKSHHLPEVLTKKEVIKMLEVFPLRGNLNIRNRTILEIFYATGIRIGELLNLTLYDVDLETNTLCVSSGKGDKTRIIPLTETAREILSLYIKTSRAYYTRNCSNNLLFVSIKSGAKLHHPNVWTIVKQASTKANITKKVSPHTLRHSFATHLLSGKADIRQIQLLLGHKNLASTEIYTQIAVSDLRKVLQRCHPREKKK